MGPERAPSNMPLQPPHSAVTSLACASAAPAGGRLNGGVRRSKAGLLIAAFLGLAHVATSQSLPPGAISFPGAERARCPGEVRYDVVYRVPPPPHDNHQLALQDRRDGKETPLLAFDRHAEVLWSPDCTALAVTDWYGSDASRVLVYVVPGTAPVADVGHAIERQLGRLPSLFGNHHVYLQAVAWPDATTLRVRANGYGEVNPNGFEAFFRYQLIGKVHAEEPAN